jgi:tetratricopeptide (TPR) repeat protein
VEKKHRESAFSFNLARLEYASRHYGHVLELLQHANYRDPLLNLAAKTLLLKTYYDLREHDLLQSHLDAMRNYVQRKRVIGYHRTNYLNIIRYTEKMLRLNPMDKAAVEALRKAVEGEAVLTEKGFLMGKLGFTPPPSNA